MGQTATFTCRGNGNPSYLHINGYNPDGDSVLKQQLQANNISWVKVINGSVTTYTVNIVATLSNNYTEIWCNFEQLGTTYRSHTAHMIAVTGEKHMQSIQKHNPLTLKLSLFDLLPSGLPGPPEDFTVQVTNMTALTLTWTAPWPHPISNYIVTMLNLSSSQKSKWGTNENQFVLRGGGGGQCDELQFTVKAVTEVGNSTGSPPARKGFPMGMQFVAV